MKKFILLFLLIPSLCFAVEPIDFSKSIAMSPAMLGLAGGKVAAAAGCGGGTSYLLCENFGSTNACYSGDATFVNCDLTWTKVGTPGGVDFKYATSPAPLEGSYSFTAVDANADTDGFVYAFTANDTVHFFFILSPITRAVGCFVSLLDSSDNVVMRVYDAGPEFAIYCNDTLGYSTAIVNGTTYYVWGDYTKGSGSNASCHLFHSTDTTKGSADITITNGNSTAQAAKLKINTTAGVRKHIYDKIRVSTSSIGDNPN